MKNKNIKKINKKKSIKKNKLIFLFFNKQYLETAPKRRV
jgi:hypothetical protein